MFLFRPILGFNALLMVASLALLVPSIAAHVRRLHDTGKSGWYLLVLLIPFVGLILYYFLVLPSVPESNEYGAASSEPMPAAF